MDTEAAPVVTVCPLLLLSWYDTVLIACEYEAMSTTAHIAATTCAVVINVSNDSRCFGNQYNNPIITSATAHSKTIHSTMMSQTRPYVCNSDATAGYTTLDDEWHVCICIA